MTAPEASPFRVRVELYGIPRQRAGSSQAILELAGSPCLGDVLEALVRKYPGLSPDCISGRTLGPACAANLAGERFIDQSDSPIPPGDAVLLLSADAGG